MRLTFLIIGSLILGCGQSPTDTDSQSTVVDTLPSSSGGDVDAIAQVFETHSATEDELQFSTAEVAKKISESGNWKPVTLSETGVGKYEAIAMTKDDREFSMEVRQTKDGIYWRWTNEDGSSGGSGMTTW